MVCKNRTVKLPSRELAELGIDRSMKRKALACLQAAGLIRVDIEAGKSADVTLLWQP
jgi:hypothetical protein